MGRGWGGCGCGCCRGGGGGGGGQELKITTNLQPLKKNVMRVKADSNPSFRLLTSLGLTLLADTSANLIMQNHSGGDSTLFTPFPSRYIPPGILAPASASSEKTASSKVNNNKNQKPCNFRVCAVVFSQLTTLATLPVYCK